MPHAPAAAMLALALTLPTPAPTTHAPVTQVTQVTHGADGPTMADGPAQEDSAVAFRLHDQFGHVHDAADYRGRVVILVGAGRAGRADGTAWVDALRGLQGDTAGLPPIPVVAVADLRGVPRLLRRVVRGRFPDDRRRAVLLDWDGTLARRLGVDAGRCTIVLVGPDGAPIARTTPTALDTAAAHALLRQAARLAAPATTASPR